MEKKNMGFIEANKKYGLNLFGDADKDKVMNAWDCKPYDKKRDGVFGRLVNVVTKGEHGQSKEDYDDERIRNKALNLHKRQEDATRRADLRRAEKEAYQKAYAQGRIARASKEGAQAGSRRWYDSLSNIGISSPTPSRNVTRGVSRGSKKKKKKKGKRRRTGRSRSSGGFFDVGSNFDIADNWGFFK